MPANLENSAVTTGLENVGFHSNAKESQCQKMFKLPHNYTHFTHAKKCSKFSKRDFNSAGTENFLMFNLDLEKAEEPEINVSICWIIEKAREFQKNHLLLLY